MSPTGPPTELFADELHDDTDVEKGKTESVTSGGLKFGWIQGVLVRKLTSCTKLIVNLNFTRSEILIIIDVICG